MAKKDKVYMPSGSGGLMRYGEEGKTLIKLKPKHVTYVVAAVVGFELVLKFFF
ncbi:MAG: preprotein translocase subunit Sec61beta [Candidatus Syntrophoarchaeum sp.]|nr:preprotein translocase subunit Sec61beta [Candidatus Syntrophoarchaeum sp.]